MFSLLLMLMGIITLDLCIVIDRVLIDPKFFNSYGNKFIGEGINIAIINTNRFFYENYNMYFWEWRFNVVS